MATGRPLIMIPLALATGFVALNVLSMVVTDFYLGLFLFHLAVGLAAAVLLHRARWLGALLLALTLALGVLT
jgi:hypothetical protein